MCSRGSSIFSKAILPKLFEKLFCQSFLKSYFAKAFEKLFCQSF